MNALKTTALLGLLTAMLVLAGGAVAGQQGMLVMLVVSAGMNLGSWYFSDRIVLATSGAVPIEDPRLRWLEDDVAALAKAADMPKPRVFIVPGEASPNAFATGRSPAQGVVAVTAGLLNTLDRRQIRGVLAHELGHIKNRDTLTSAIAATMAGALTFLSRMMMFGGRDRNSNPLAGLVIMIGAPFAALLIRMMISRTREYEADATAARMTGDPEGLAQALARIAGMGQRVPMRTGSEATHYIANNFGGAMGQWFSTHPPMDERIRRLQAMR